MAEGHIESNLCVWLCVCVCVCVLAEGHIESNLCVCVCVFVVPKSCLGHNLAIHNEI